MSKLNEKVALITGGSRGIGAAIAKRLAADGASVAITYAKEASAASAVVKAIELSGGKAVAIQADANGRGRRLGADDPRRAARDPGARYQRGTARAVRSPHVFETARGAEQQSGRTRSTVGVPRPGLRRLSRERGL